jgi:hypothetical protein
MRRPRPLGTSVLPSLKPLELGVDVPTQRAVPVIDGSGVEVADEVAELAAELEPELEAASPSVPGANQTSASGSPVRRLTPRGRLLLALALIVALAVGGAGATLAHADRVAAQAALEARTALAASQAHAFSAEQRMLREQNMAASWARTLAKQTAAAAAGTTSLAASQAALAGAPQAGADARAALQAAIDAAAAVLATVPTRSVITLDAAVATVAAPLAAVIASQAAWQVVEDARLAAENAAAAAAAQASRSTTATRKATASSSSAGSTAAAAPATTAGAPEFSAGALGSAINAYRATQGLGALSISRSSTLVAHTGAMAAAGSIWHSGSDNIVGYVQPASASALVQAWANSPAHKAWMVNTSVSSMQIGAVVLNGRLYGAVGFN